MSAIKRFFERKKMEVKFSQAGKGHKLTGPTTTPSSLSSSSSGSSISSSGRAGISGTSSPRTVAPESAQRAGAAALARFEQQQHHKPTMANRSQFVIRQEALKELEAERLRNESSDANAESSASTTTTQQPKEVYRDTAPVLSVNGVYFKCPLIGPDVLPLDEMRKKIRVFLYEQLEEERGLTSCLIIRTCNTNRDKVNVCVQTLCKYLENLISDPSNEKFRKIRVNNKVFQERVANLEGVDDFLLAAGFVLESIAPTAEGAEPEGFYVYPIDNVEHADSLVVLIDALQTSEAILPELDRSVKVLAPSSTTERFSLPPDFYNLTADELKREQQIRAELVEKNQVLRTKAMREREETREYRKYRYTLLRIRFPDGIMLQGTFFVGESLQAVWDFVNEHLEHKELPFVLSTATGHRLSPSLYESPLLDLKLVPAAIVNFSWDPETFDLERDEVPKKFLTDETMALIQSL